MNLRVGLGDALVAVEADDLDEHLNNIERRLAEPTLVTLTNGEATMHIGLGDPDHSIALFHDTEGRSWASQGNETIVQLAFRKGEHRYEFYPSAAISPVQARSAAIEFAASNRRPTATITWKPEPGHGGAQRHISL